jgi:hypothetical protein
MDLQGVGELAQKIDKLEKNFAKADYILSEVMIALALVPGVNDMGHAWAVRNYQEYLKDTERG